MYPTHNDTKTRDIIITLRNLVAQREDYEWNLQYNPEECVSGSGYDPRGKLEWPCIVEIYDQLRMKGEWTVEELFMAGRIGPEDDFGLNPDYLRAKLLWWKHKRGIDGIVAIIRYQMEVTRALRSPLAKPFFMSEQEEKELNDDSIDRCYYQFDEPPSPYIPPDMRIFDATHEIPVEYTYLALDVWRTSKVADPTETLPHNLFYDTECAEQTREAYHALLEYQNSFEPGTKLHIQKEDWARPQLLKPSSPIMRILLAQLQVQRLSFWAFQRTSQSPHQPYTPLLQIPRGARPWSTVPI
jgi:hypothetical protein